MAAQVVDVLVVGAGPAGLTAAATLRRALPAMTARALGIAPGDSLLVRPSGVPARNRSGIALAAGVHP